MGDDYGGGDYYDPAYDTPAGEPIADDETVDCHLADEGACDLRAPTPEELARVRAEIERIRTDGVCGDVKRMATEMVGHGLMVWDNEVRQGGLLVVGDRMPIFVGPTGTERVSTLHLWTDPRGLNAWTIAHEALHGRGYSHTDLIQAPDGRQYVLDRLAKFCAQV